MLQRRALGRLAVVFLVVSLAVGCGSGATPEQEQVVTPPAPTPTATAAPIPSPTPQPTKAPGSGLVATPTPTQTPLPQKTPTVEPKRGGVVRQSLVRDLVGFDPNNTTSGIDNELNMMFNSSLVWNCESVVICTEAAEEWAWAADGKSLTFRLRDNVVFPNGKKMTAGDVKWSFEKMMGFNKAFAVSARVGWMTNYIEGIEVVDERTVKFKTFHTAPALIGLMATGFASIIPQGTTEDEMKKKPVGVGPFILGEHLPGALYRLQRNTKYFIPGMPYLDEIQFPIISDPAAIEAAFLTRKTDIKGGSSATTAPWTPSNEPKIRQAIAKGTVRMVEVPGGRLTGVWMPWNKAPWNDVRVRKAVNLTLDRDQYSQGIQDGHGIVSLLLNEGIPNQGRGEAAIRKLPGYRDKEVDRAEARKLMADAGFPNGFDTVQEYRISGADPSASVGTVFIQDQLARIGIRTKLEGIRDPTHFERFSRLDYSIQQYGFVQQTLDPDELFGQYFLCNASRNWTGYCNPKLQEMFDAMSGELDPVKRGELSRKMEDLVVFEDAVYAPIPQENRFYTWYSDVHPHAPGGWYITWYTEPKRLTWWRE
ncbi:MAG: ABC transporter substrate-binding protein [Chloroflexi bacterium]|nr:ABC transporter substrate-binding protein [Chloroflexota bacterium]